jgi:hypothetical protein
LPGRRALLSVISRRGRFTILNPHDLAGHRLILTQNMHRQPGGEKALNRFRRVRH